MDSNDTTPIIDYVEDGEYIVGSFMQAYGIDLTICDMHWHMFKALLLSLPENSKMFAADSRCLVEECLTVCNTQDTFHLNTALDGIDHLGRFLCQRVIQLLLSLLRIDSGFVEEIPCASFSHAQNTQQQVLGFDVLVKESLSLLPSKTQYILVRVCSRFDKLNYILIFVAV